MKIYISTEEFLLMILKRTKITFINRQRLHNLTTFVRHHFLLLIIVVAIKAIFPTYKY